MIVQVDKFSGADRAFTPRRPARSGSNRYSCIADALADRPQQRYANALREDRREPQEKPPLLLGDCGMSILRLCSGQSAELLAAGGDDHAALALLAAAGSLAAFCVG
jgi:hypothetical protein